MYLNKYEFVQDRSQPQKKEKEVVDPEATASDFITTTSGMT